MYLHFVGTEINQYDMIPIKIQCENGSYIYNIDLMTVEQREAVGLYEYTDITQLDGQHIWNGEWEYDHANKTAVKVLIDISGEQSQIRQINNYAAVTGIRIKKLIKQGKIYDAIALKGGL